MSLIHWLSTCLLLASAAPLLAAESKWTFEEWDGPDFPVRMFIPDNADSQTKIVVVMHGASRGASRYFRDWKALGDKHDLIIVI
jgi:poly(3-hydroxybutyrate) depolymerase